MKKKTIKIKTLKEREKTLLNQTTNNFKKTRNREKSSISSDHQPIKQKINMKEQTLKAHQTGGNERP